MDTVCLGHDEVIHRDVTLKEVVISPELTAVEGDRARRYGLDLRPRTTVLLGLAAVRGHAGPARTAGCFPTSIELH